MPAEDTKTRILDAAERLFAERGFPAVSMRAITGKAGVNLAAVHYHFGSKQELIRSVLQRYAVPLNAERIRLLDEIEKRAGGDVPPLEEVLGAFFEPAVRFGSRSGGNLIRLFTLAHSDPNPEMERLFYSLFHEIVHRFSAALGRCLPHLDHERVILRMMFGIGAMGPTLAKPAAAARLAGSPDKKVESADLLDELVAYVAAGMRAPIAEGGS